MSVKVEKRGEERSDRSNKGHQDNDNWIIDDYFKLRDRWQSSETVRGQRANNMESQLSESDS